MKRTSRINLSRHRKAGSGRLERGGASALVGTAMLSGVLTSTIGLSGCSTNDTTVADIYLDAEHCIENNPEQEDACRASYSEAVAESERTAPKYASQQDCEAEFGSENCQSVERAEGGSFFMPLMAGYMLGQLMNGQRRAVNPLYSSSRPDSPMHQRWTGADGKTYGRATPGQVRVPVDALKPKPTQMNTLQRGRFGAAVARKTALQRSSFRSGWGG